MCYHNHRGVRAQCLLTDQHSEFDSESDKDLVPDHDAVQWG